MAAISIFDIFKIGIGPSSSHTGGPMKAARAFAEQLEPVASDVAAVQVTLYGSLAYTGKGHGTDSAVVLGLMGLEPETIDPDSVESLLRAIHADKQLQVQGVGKLRFDPDLDVVFEFGDELPRHTNGMRFVARDEGGRELLSEDYYSLGGGFIARGDEPEVASQTGAPPYPYDSADSLLRMAAENDLSIAELIHANELTWRTADEIRERMNSLWAAMKSCIDRGLRTEGVLPGKLSVLRRAARLHKRLTDRVVPSALDAMEWVNVFAIAVNEENAAGGRVVAAGGEWKEFFEILGQTDAVQALSDAIEVLGFTTEETGDNVALVGRLISEATDEKLAENADKQARRVSALREQIRALNAEIQTEVDLPAHLTNIPGLANM
ncbi:MAG: L-serine ammonia-lyase, iron-sulfur-dependent, subunit alpha, partial [Proteobacteria bacterium]|nr:L-serine ammonia-lyase, iron-sulfur-dependent, subunit alpha [Pseudomonadota bacterium]